MSLSSGPSADLIKSLVNLNETSSSLTKIMDLEVHRLKKGDNYVSDSARVKVTMMRGDGTVVPVFYFYKMLPQTEHTKKLINELGVFTTEIKMYKEILPRMQELLYSIEDFDEIQWPDLLGVHKSDTILLKDLRSFGYFAVDKRVGLNFEQSSIVLQAMAKFHALSVIMLDRCMLDVGSFRRCCFLNTSDDIQKHLRIRISALADLMGTWEPKWDKLRSQLKRLSKDVSGVLTRIAQLDPQVFNVLNHGDIWTCNVFFKSCQFTKNLCGVKFVDFQNCHYGSYGNDIQYFIYTSVQSHVRSEQYEALIKAYHGSLEHWLTKFGYERIPSFQEVRKETDRRMLYGVILAAYTLHLMQATAEDAIDLEISLSGEDPAGHILATEHYQNKAKDILQQLIGQDWLDKYL